MLQDLNPKKELLLNMWLFFESLSIIFLPTRLWHVTMGLNQNLIAKSYSKGP